MLLQLLPQAFWKHLTLEKMVHILNLFGEGCLSFICIISCNVQPPRFLEGTKCRRGKQPLKSLGEEIAPRFPLIKESNGPKKTSEDLIPLREFCLGNLRVWADRCISAALTGSRIPKEIWTFQWS